MNKLKKIDFKDANPYDNTIYPTITLQDAKKLISKSYNKSQLTDLIAQIICCLQNDTTLSAKKKLEKIGYDICGELFEIFMRTQDAKPKT